VKKVPRWAIAVVTASVLVGLIAAAASARTSSPAKQAASIKACALLPDTTSSTRYTLFDAPYLKAAFKKAGIAATVVNAHNDPQKQKSQAQQCLAQGAKVILLDQLDATSGASITNLAVSQHAKVIDYDRLLLRVVPEPGRRQAPGKRHDRRAKGSGQVFTAPGDRRAER
jgi:D-xylose transport system substrate-binding protein